MCQLYTVQTNLESVCQIREMMTTPEIYLYVLLLGEEFYFQADREKCVCVCVCVCMCVCVCVCVPSTSTKASQEGRSQSKRAEWINLESVLIQHEKV